ncbi:MAG: YidB family protein [Ignavibacteria bacterium]|nr:YidB family protein [Ignavibacteria bacterium]
MDLFGSIKSMLGGASENQQTDLVSTIMNMIGNQTGGLGAFVNQFAEKGLGDIAQSWVSTGKNLPISPEQIQSVLGSDVVKGIASKLGVDTNSLAGQLSNLIPQVVDKLTPDGKIPEGDILSQGMDLLGGLFGKK